MPLPQYKQNLLEAELESGERLLWAGEPDPRLAARQAKIYCVFGLFWTIGVLNVVHLGWNAEKPSGSDWTFERIGTAAIMVPCLLIGLYMLFMPVWIYYKFGRTVYSITSERILIMIDGKPRQVESYRRSEIGTLTRTDCTNAVGHLSINYQPAEARDGVRRVTGTMFFGIPDVRQVETVLRNALIMNDAQEA